MQRRVVPLAAFFLAAACGGRTPLDVGGSTSSSGSAPGGSTPINCIYGKIASVSGLPLGIASTGQNIFIVSADVGGVTGTLDEITSDGAVHVVDGNAFIGMATYGSTIAFNRRTFDNQQNLLSATIEIVNSDFSTTTIDSTNANVAQVDSLTTDGTSLYWYRWAALSDPIDVGIYGAPSISRYSGGAITSIPTTAAVDQDLVTDGIDSFFASSSDTSPSIVVAAYPLDGSPMIVLAEIPEDFIADLSVVGVDDTNVVIVTDFGVWSIPKTGGAPTQIVGAQTFEGSTALGDHHFIWTVQNAGGSGSISAVSTSGGAIENVASSTSSIPVFTTDACGLVYATTDSSAPGATAGSVYRAKL